MNPKIILQLLFTTFIWGLSFHAAKEVVGALSFDYVALGRYAIASVFFLICTPLSIQQYKKLLQRARVAIVVSGVGRYFWIQSPAVPRHTICVCHECRFDHELYARVNRCAFPIFIENNTFILPAIWIGFRHSRCLIYYSKRRLDTFKKFEHWAR